MLSRPTTLILGAGASAPYDFPTGTGLLAYAKGLSLDQLVTHIAPRRRPEAAALREVLMRNRLDQSIDAMLAGAGLPINAGKALIARSLLRCERAALAPGRTVERPWYSALWDALDQTSLSSFRRNPITIVTFNYDRSLEFDILMTLSARFPGRPAEEYAQAIDCIGPIYLHGKLSNLPENPGGLRDTVPYGGEGPDITDADVDLASQGIKIVSDADMNSGRSQNRSTPSPTRCAWRFLDLHFTPRTFDTFSSSDACAQTRLYLRARTGYKRLSTRLSAVDSIGSVSVSVTSAMTY